MNPGTKWTVVRIILTSTTLMAGWILFTGSVSPNTMILGGIFSIIIGVTMYGIFIDPSEAARKTLLPRLPLLIVFVLITIYKMYAGSFAVLWAALTGRYTSRIVFFRTRLKSDIARVLLANTITLTPGTVTLDLDDDHLVVHWLNATTTHSRYAARMIAGPFEKILAKIWS